jgi:hypothetical protein
MTQQSSDDPHGVGLDGLRNGEEFDHIQPALAALKLRHERLRPFQAPGDLLLGQTRLLAGSNQQLAECALPGRMDRFAYAARTRGYSAGRLIPLWNYPKTG